MASSNKQSSRFIVKIGLATLGFSFSLFALAEESLRDLSYKDFVESIQDSKASDLDKKIKALTAERLKLKYSTNRSEIDAKAKEKEQAAYSHDLTDIFAADLKKHLGSSDNSDVRKGLMEKIQSAVSENASEIVAKMDHDEDSKIATSEAEAEPKVVSIDDAENPSLFQIEVRTWKNKEGKIVSNAQLVPKDDAFDKEVPLPGFREAKKVFDKSAFEKQLEDFSKAVMPKSDNVQADDPKISSETAKKISEDLSKSLSMTSDKTRSALETRLNTLALDYENAKSELSDLLEKHDPKQGQAKLANMELLAKAVKNNKGKEGIDPCKLVLETLKSAKVSQEDLEECAPAIAKKKGAVSEEGHSSLDADRLLRKKGTGKDSETVGGANEFSASNSSTASQQPAMPPMDPMMMQAQMQREANLSACLGANQQLMAAIPQMELDRKFNSLLQGFESIIPGSTLIPQVLNRIPADSSGAGSYALAQSAVESLIEDWDVKDPEVQRKVKNELNLAEAATSKAAADLEAYRFRLMRMGMDPAFGVPMDSPEGVKLAKLERDLAAAGSVKDSMRKVHATIVQLTRSSLSPLNSGLGRTSRDSAVPSVGTPRVAPSR